MWLGESEKIAKRIFNDYKKFWSECERTPILLFNEADAVLSTRTTGSQQNQSVNQTLNAVQNIILEELENFKGILIATTNLEKNLDPAFERRFLYKVQFHKPNIESKGKIWKLKIPSLTEEECNRLAKSYDFSGGEIDNIVRKAELTEILNGEFPDFKTILEFCDSELISRKNYGKIGF
jgi:SpoVK/Ycf46/Vps4 family AAA+-type ATPase